MSLHFKHRAPSNIQPTSLIQQKSNALFYCLIRSFFFNLRKLEEPEKKQNLTQDQYVVQNLKHHKSWSTSFIENDSNLLGFGVIKHLARYCRQLILFPTERLESMRFRIVHHWLLWQI